MSKYKFDIDREPSIMEVISSLGGWRIVPISKYRSTGPQLAVHHGTFEEFVRALNCERKSNSGDSAVAEEHPLLSLVPITRTARKFIMWPIINPIIDPTSRSCLVWDGLGLIAIIYDLVMIPLSLFDLPGIKKRTKRMYTSV